MLRQSDTDGVVKEHDGRPSARFGRDYTPTATSSFFHHAQPTADHVELSPVSAQINLKNRLDLFFDYGEDLKVCVKDAAESRLYVTLPSSTLLGMPGSAKLGMTLSAELKQLLDLDVDDFVHFQPRGHGLTFEHDDMTFGIDTLPGRFEVYVEMAELVTGRLPQSRVATLRAERDEIARALEAFQDIKKERSGWYDRLDGLAAKRPSVFWVSPICCVDRRQGKLLTVSEQVAYLHQGDSSGAVLQLAAPHRPNKNKHTIRSAMMKPLPGRGEASLLGYVTQKSSHPRLFFVYEHEPVEVPFGHSFQRPSEMYTSNRWRILRRQAPRHPPRPRTRQLRLRARRPQPHPGSLPEPSHEAPGTKSYAASNPTRSNEPAQGPAKTSNDH